MEDGNTEAQEKEATCARAPASLAVRSSTEFRSPDSQGQRPVPLAMHTRTTRARGDQGDLPPLTHHSARRTGGQQADAETGALSLCVQKAPTGLSPHSWHRTLGHVLVKGVEGERPRVCAAQKRRPFVEDVLTQLISSVQHPVKMTAVTLCLLMRNGTHRG